jgi:hypothetical protein
MTRKLFALCTTVAMTFFLLPQADIWSDTVELSRGGHLTGDVSWTKDKQRLVVRVDDDIRVALPASRVRRVVMSDELAKYEELAKLAGDDAERHYQLGLLCVRSEKFPGDADHYKRFHMKRAVELDPDHSEARAQLGYKKEKGQWIRISELQRRRGMVYYQGQWQLPEAVAMMKAQDEANLTSKKWIKEVDRLTGIILRGRGKTNEALESLRAIRDPLAAGAIAWQFNHSRGKQIHSRDLRRLWVSLLGGFRNAESVKALVLAGVDEPDATIREAALEQLTSYGAGSAVATYVPMLRADDNAVVNRAARALSWFPDRELALTYVDALVTTHTKEIPASGQTSAGFTPDGGGGMQMGSKKVTISRDFKNPSVLGLLNLIEPDAHYGYDESAWRHHFASQLTAYDGDLRRDP